MKTDIAEKVALRRKQLGLSQRRLADLSGLSPALISALENKSRNISLANLEKLLTALDLSLSIDVAEYDWDVLCALGCPLQSRNNYKVELTFANLSYELAKAVTHLETRSSDPELSRHRYAVAALFRAIHNLYPDLYEKMSLTYQPRLRDTNKLHKLTKIAEARISEYL